MFLRRCFIATDNNRKRGNKRVYLALQDRNKSRCFSANNRIWLVTNLSHAVINSLTLTFLRRFNGCRGSCSDVRRRLCDEAAQRKNSRFDDLSNVQRSIGQLVHSLDSIKYVAYSNIY